MLTWVCVLAVLSMGSVTTHYSLNLSEPPFSLWQSGEQRYLLCRILRLSKKEKIHVKGQTRYSAHIQCPVIVA